MMGFILEPDLMGFILEPDLLDFVRFVIHGGVGLADGCVWLLFGCCLVWLTKIGALARRRGHVPLWAWVNFAGRLIVVGRGRFSQFFNGNFQNF
jgi:hypothetical protein